MQALALTLPLLIAPDGSAPETTAPPETPPTESNADIGRRIDMRALDALLPNHAEGEPEGDAFVAVPLIRTMPSKPEEDLGSDGEEWGNRPSAIVADMVVDLYGEGIGIIEPVADGVYYVTGDEATIEGIEAFVGHVTASVGGAPRVRISRLRADAGDAARLRRGAGLGEVGEVLSVRETTLIPGIPTRCSDVTTDTIVAAPETQIAQGSAIIDPAVVEAASGVDLTLSCRRERGDLRLTYTLAHTARTKPASIKKVTFPALLGSDGGGVELSQRMGWNESYAVEGGALVGETSLRPGQRAVLGGMDDELIVIEVVDGAVAPDIPQYELPDGSLVVMLESAAVSAPTIEPRGLLLTHNYTLEHDLWHFLDGLGAMWKAPSAAAYDIIFDGLDAIPTQYALPGFTLLVLEPETAPKLGPWIDFMSAPSGAPLSVAVRHADGRSLGAFESSAGADAVVALGIEELMAKDSEVEVAQYAAIESSLVRTHFQGFAGTVRLSPLPGNRLAYEVRGQLSTDVSRSERSRTVDTAGGAEAVEARHVTFDERGTVAARGDGGWLIVLGDASGNGPGVQLEVSARR